MSEEMSPAALILKYGLWILLAALVIAAIITVLKKFGIA
jgi:hypothetical protein